MGDGAARCLRVPAVIVALGLLLVASLHAQSVSHCVEATNFLQDDRRTVTVTEPDTIDDWRTGRRVAGCRVTAAGVTRLSIAEEAARFYERLRAAGWTRTPDARDAPGEASVRMRNGGSDCLFNVYAGALLLTEAERKVMAGAVPSADESRYGVLVQCMEALPARPR